MIFTIVSQWTASLRLFMDLLRFRCALLVLILLSSSRCSAGERQDGMDCGKLIQVDKPSMPLRTKDLSLAGHAMCPPDFVGGCMSEVTYRVENETRRKNTKLCAVGRYFMNCHQGKDSITISSRLLTLKIFCGVENKDINLCAPPGGNLYFTFRSRDGCDPDYPVVYPDGQIVIKRMPSYKNIINMVSRKSCYLDNHLRLGREQSGALLSSYEFGQTGTIYFCEATIDKLKNKKLCLKFVDFLTYHEGAKLSIRTRSTDYVVDGSSVPENREFCIDSKHGSYVSFSVSAHRDGFKPHHYFLLEYSLTDIEDENDDDDDDDDFDSRLFWLFSIPAAVIVCCFFYYGCKEEKDDIDMRNEAHEDHRRSLSAESDPEAHDLEPIPPTGRAGHRNSYREEEGTEGNTVLIPEPTESHPTPTAPLVEQLAPSSTFEAPPSYHSLFPENK